MFALDPRLKLVSYNLSSDKIKTPVKIAMIADLHSCYYGKGQQSLLNKIESEEPGIVVFCGDIFDDELDFRNAEVLLKAVG